MESNEVVGVAVGAGKGRRGVEEISKGNQQSEGST